MAWEGDQVDPEAFDEPDHLAELDEELSDDGADSLDDSADFEPFDLSPISPEQAEAMDPKDLKEIRRLRSGWKRRQQAANPM